MSEDLQDGGAITDQLAKSKTDRPGAQGTPGDVPEPLALIELALRAPETAKQCYPNYRLTRLVASRLELDDADMALLAAILGLRLCEPASGVPRPFDHHLRHMIFAYGLGALFSDNGPGAHHHAIRPIGYDFHCDEVIPIGMEQWRADYRAMSDERQMLAASILWLYRAGKDNCWLRRVPCTWHAADAIDHMKATGVLADWARLFALYPGW